MSFRRGDIIMMNFSPQAGHEQAGRRPALVLSSAFYHKVTNMAIICPITSKVRNYPLHVHLDERTSVQGDVMCQQMRSADLAARGAVLVERIPDDLMDEVLDRIRLFFD